MSAEEPGAEVEKPIEGTEEGAKLLQEEPAPAEKGKSSSACCVHPEHKKKKKKAAGSQEDAFAAGFAKAISTDTPGGKKKEDHDHHHHHHHHDHDGCDHHHHDTDADDDGDLIPEAELLDALEIPADCPDGDCTLMQLRIFNMDRLPLEKLRNCRSLILRQNLIHAISPLPANLEDTLEEFELFDNKLRRIDNLDNLRCLKILDLSYNNIRIIEGLSELHTLETLYLTENKITKIQNLENLTNLRLLELGSNRIREIKGLETLTKLEDLWLGKNKITKLQGLEGLSKLRRLSLQANRLTKIPEEGLRDNTALTDLHIAENGLKSMENIGHLRHLRLLDFCMNPISKIEGVDTLQLQELWVTDARISDWREIAKLESMKSLRTLYMERNPLEDVRYRHKLATLLPQLTEIDSWSVVRRDLTGDVEDGQDPRGTWVDGEDADLTFKASRGDANPVRPLTEADRDKIASAAEQRRQQHQRNPPPQRSGYSSTPPAAAADAPAPVQEPPPEPSEPLWGNAGAAGAGIGVLAATLSAAAVVQFRMDDVD